MGALALLLVGVGIGFSIGRATAPKVPAAQTQATIPVESTDTSSAADATDTLDSTDSSDTAITDETTSSADATVATAPRRPRQLSPSNGAVINASRVSLHWSKITDDNGGKITYSFQLQNRVSGGWGSSQTITGVKSTSYSVRVLSSRRRWRVWAVNGDGTKSKVTDWRTFVHKYVAPKKSTPTSSTTTTGTEH